MHEYTIPCLFHALLPTHSDYCNSTCLYHFILSSHHSFHILCLNKPLSDFPSAGTFIRFFYYLFSSFHVLHVTSFICIMFLHFPGHLFLLSLMINLLLALGLHIFNAMLFTLFETCFLSSSAVTWCLGEGESGKGASATRIRGRNSRHNLKWQGAWIVWV